MAPEQSVIFAPEMDERQLDREVSQVDEQLQEVGQGVPVDFDDQGMDGLGMPEGGLDGMGGGGGGGLGPGAGAGATGLASKLPKPVAGVSVASAVPVALAGGVGLGMLSAMQSASARLQTSTAMLSTAWQNIWRAPGDLLDEHVVRPLAEEILGMSVEFEEDFREDPVGATIELGGDLLGGRTGGLAALFQPGLIGPIAAHKIITGQITPSDIISGAIDLGEWVGSGIGDLAGWVDEGLGDLAGWVDDGIGDLSTWVSGGLDDFVDDWDWTPLRNMEPWSWNPLNFINTGGGGGGDTATGGVAGDRQFQAAPGRQRQLESQGRPGRTPTSGSRDLFMGAYWETASQFLPGFQAGGRVSRTGVAEVHRGELIADPDRLVDDLASAIEGAGGGGATTDTTAIEDKLDRLHSDMKRLERALDVTLQVGREEIARASAEGKTHDLADSDPTV